MCDTISDGSGSKFFDPGRVSHLWFGFEFGKFPLKMSNFSIFSLRVKKNIFGSGRKVPGLKAGRPLIYCGSKVSSGRVGSDQGSFLDMILVIVILFSLLQFACLQSSIYPSPFYQFFSNPLRCIVLFTV